MKKMNELKLDMIDTHSIDRHRIVKRWLVGDIPTSVMIAYLNIKE